jgi:uncharacterized membrane protein YgdD (TMEM256/DUF423 family)
MNKLMQNRSLLVICGIVGALAVGLGAFGAHGLKGILSENQLQTYATGVTYHFYHALSLFGVLLFNWISPSKWFKRSAYCFIIGITLFSGSLYLLSTREIIGLTSYRWLGPITPIGGVFFIAGWLLLSIGAYTNNDLNAAN